MQSLADAVAPYARLLADCSTPLAGGALLLLWLPEKVIFYLHK